jgi:hypothetical protein
MRNLLIVQDPPLQDPADFLVIKKRIDETAPDIEVRIINNRRSDPVTEAWQASRPSLVFSPFVLLGYKPRGGAVFSGQPYGKIEQIKRLSRLGLQVPRMQILQPPVGANFDSREWGDYIIFKPDSANSGMGVRLVRPDSLPGQLRKWMQPDWELYSVQEYIDHTEDGYPTEYRVLSMFGKALYCARNRWGNRRPPLNEIADDPAGIIASNDKHMGGRVREACNDPEIIALGERAHSAFPECAIIGVDIIRSANGTLYVLETNPHGAVWHLSSHLLDRYPEHRRDLYAQFNALDRAAELLIERTRAEAR